jgi:integrase
MESPRVLLADDLPGMLETVKQLLRTILRSSGMRKAEKTRLKLPQPTIPIFFYSI